MTLLDDLRDLAAEFRTGGDEHTAVRLETVIAKHTPQRAGSRRPLTDRQRQILDFIAGHARRGLPPTLREIGKAFGMRSTNAVADHLKLIERKGYLERTPLKSRGLRVIDWP